MSLKNRNVWPYLAIIALSAALIADNVIATPSDGFDNGMPGRLEDRLTEIQIQIDDFRNYVEGSSSDVFDLSSAVCFDVSLGGDVGLGLGATGDLHAGIGTGVDLYGLLDIDAGGALQAALDAQLGIGGGVHGSVQICLNLGLLKVDSLGNVQGPGGIELNSAQRSRRGIGDVVPQELLDLASETQDMALAVYDQIPALFDTFDIRPDAILDGFEMIGDFFSEDIGTAVTNSLSLDYWDDAVANLPGADYLSAQFDGVFASFTQLSDGDVCGFLDSVGGSIDPSVGNVLDTICSAVPAGIDTSIDAISSTVDVVYTTLTETISTISYWVTTIYTFAHDTMYPVIDTINGVVNSIDGVVDAVCSAVPGC